MKRKSMSAYIQVSAKCMGACFCMGVFISLGQSKLSFRVMWGSVKNVCMYLGITVRYWVHLYIHTHTHFLSANSWQRITGKVMLRSALFDYVIDICGPKSFTFRHNINPSLQKSHVVQTTHNHSSSNGGDSKYKRLHLKTVR